ncbi:hypothetical protein HDU76_011029, partial [Blyttiomyces sp. JEL0837]
SQNRVHWLQLLKRHNYNIAANIPNNCILLKGKITKMINWLLDNGILPKSKDEVKQLALHAINNRFHTCITRLINLGLISALEIFDLMIDELLETDDADVIDSYCVILQGLNHMGVLEGVLNERRHYELKMLLKCVEVGGEKSRTGNKEYICLERCLLAGVGKSFNQIPPPPPLTNTNLESDYIQRNTNTDTDTAVLKAFINYSPRAVIWFLNTPGYQPSVETLRSLLQYTFRREEPMLDVFDYIVKIVMEIEKDDELGIVYEELYKVYLDKSELSTHVDLDSRIVDVLEVLASRSYDKVALRNLVDVVSNVSILTLIAERCKSPEAVFFWMFDVKLVSDSIPEMNMNSLLTKLLDKKLFNVIFTGFVGRNVCGFDTFTKVLRDWFKKNTGGVMDKDDESNPGIEL